MLIKLLVSRASMAGNQEIGDEIDVPNGEAKRMIEASQAVPVRRRKVEKAVK